MNQARAKNGHGTYRAPTLIALASMIGLVSALIGDGVFDAISWMALGAVVITLVWAFKFRWKRANRLQAVAKKKSLGRKS